MDPGRLALTVTHADGRNTRWGYDEIDSGTIPNDLTFSNSTPGGFKNLSCSLLRDLTPRSDEGLFDNVKVHGPGSQVAWDGRVTQLPRQTGSNTTVQPGAIGWGAHLEDTETFMQVYVNRGLAGWAEVDTARRVAIVTGTRPYGGVSVEIGDTLLWTPQIDTEYADEEVTEVTYRAPPGVTLTAMQYKGSRAGTWTAFETPTWYGSNDGLTYSSVATLTLDNTLRSASGTGYRRAILRSYLTSGPVTPAAATYQQYTQMALYGDSGVTTHTTAAGEPNGVYASDVVADIVTNAAPLLTVPTGGIQATTFAIPHLVFDSPVTAAEAIQRTNAYHGWDWLVWENRNFYYQPAGDGVEWLARIGDGASLSLEGDSAESILTGIVVAYQDNGVQMYAGPVGSGMDVESSSLEDASSDNPAVAHGIDRIPVLSISTPTTAAGAVELGALYLAESNLAARRGQVTLTGEVRHPSEGLVPVWRVRAGDTIKLTDRPGDAPRRIVEVEYQHSTRTATLTLDSTAHKVDALFERIAALTAALSG